MTICKVGDVTIRKLVELEAPLPLGPGSMLPDADPEAVAAVPGVVPDFATQNGRAYMSVHSFLIETPTRRIVVDTGVGNDTVRHFANSRRLQVLTLAGTKVDNIGNVAVPIPEMSALMPMIGVVGFGAIGLALSYLRQRREG